MAKTPKKTAKKKTAAGPALSKLANPANPKKAQSKSGRVKRAALKPVVRAAKVVRGGKGGRGHKAGSGR